MKEDGARFRSKIDWWVGAASCAPLLAVPFAAMLESQSFTVVLVVILLNVGLFGWTLCSTVYVVSETTLTARCMMMTRRVPLQSITALRATRNPMSAPALSLDRIEIVHADGTLLISPADKAGFVQTMLERAPAIMVEGLPVDPGQSAHRSVR